MNELKMHTGHFEVRTTQRDQMLDITQEVRQVLGEAQIRQGQVIVHIPHTTAGVTINENADPSVPHDMLAALNHAVPWSQGFYRHGEGNSAAHVKSSMVGCSQTVLVDNGKLVLGTWQGIWFCEFDGPRSRKAIVRAVGH